jgi:RES domain
MRVSSLTLQYRTYSAELAGQYHDIRGQLTIRPDLYSPNSYTASQAFGEKIRSDGGDGILFDSVRHVGGTNVVAYRPRNVRNVVMSTHYEVMVPVRGKVVARSLSA